jgi:hypothetical protein
MSISNSYLLHLVTIMEPQEMYHPRLPAPFPSSNIQAGQPAPVSTESSVPLDASATSGLLRSPAPGSPGRYQVDVQA